MIGKKNRTMNTEKNNRSVRYLACAFLITFSALIALGCGVCYAKNSARERNATLIAADLLSLRSIQSGENVEGIPEVYIALIESRLPSLAGEEVREKFSEFLRGDETSYGEMEILCGEIEETIHSGNFSAAAFVEMIKRAAAGEYKTDIGNLARAADAEKTESSMKKVPSTVNPARLAERFFGVKYVFQNARTDMEVYPAAYCNNMYIAFDPATGEMALYTAECAPGAPVLTESECVAAALQYARDRQNLKNCSPLRVIGVHGICFVQIGSDAPENSLIGVRMDTGRICFFLRSFQKTM